MNFVDRVDILSLRLLMKIFNILTDDAHISSLFHEEIANRINCFMSLIELTFLLQTIKIIDPIPDIHLVDVKVFEGQELLWVHFLFSFLCPITIITPECGNSTSY